MHSSWSASQRPIVYVADDLKNTLTVHEQNAVVHFRGPTDPPGRFTWDLKAGKTEPHWRRALGTSIPVTIQGKISKPDDFALAEVFNFNEIRDDDWAFSTLIKFVQGRPRMWDTIDTVQVMDNLARFKIENMAPCGKSVYMHMKNRQHPENPKPRSDGWVLAYHATSLYCVPRIIANEALVEGMAQLNPGGKTLKGIFCHLTQRAHLCQTSYMLHTVLNNGPFCYGCMIVMAVDPEPKREDGSALKWSVSRGTKGRTQNLTYAGQHQVLGLLVHVVRVEELCSMPADSLFIVEPNFLNDLEFDVDASWEDIQHHSAEMKQIIPGSDGARVSV